jgi:Zn-dependent protease
MFIQTLFTDPFFFLRVVVILILSVCLHELAHGWMALSQGDDTPSATGHLTLNPVVHMGWPSLIFLCLVGIVWGQMPVNPSKFRIPKWSSLLVSAAGPLMNLAIALVAILVLRLVANAEEGVISSEFFWIAAQFNLVLCLFNLLPIPPLDGFTVFSELFPPMQSMRNSPFGLIAFMVLFMSGAFGVLFQISTQIITALVT